MGLVSDIAQSYRDIGAAHAGGTRDRGVIYGNLIAGLGQVPGQIAEQQQRQKLAAQEAQIRDQQLQEGQFKLEDAKRQQAAQAALGAAMSKALNPDGSFNEDLLRQSVVSDPKTAAAWPEIQKGLMASKEASLKVRELQDKHGEAEAAHMSAIAHAADAAETPDAKASTLLIAVAGGVRDGSISQEHASPFISQMLGEDGQPDPAKVPGVIAQMKQLSAAELEKRGQAAAAMRGPQPNASTLALAAAGGDPAEALRLSKMPVESPEQSAERQAALERQAAAQAETARHDRAMEARPVGGASGAMSADDVNEIADAIIRGDQPPELTGLYGKGALVRAALAKKGYQQAQALTDWRATQKHIATLNGTQQTRLNQSINALPELLDSVESLAKEWKAGRFPLLNKANLIAAKNGVYGNNAASIAGQLQGQIADVRADLASVYMGGNSPTDEGIKLTQNALDSDWDESVLLKAIQRGRDNVRIRSNSIKNTGVAGASTGNPYASPQSAPKSNDPLGIR